MSEVVMSVQVAQCVLTTSKLSANNAIKILIIRVVLPKLSPKYFAELNEIKLGKQVDKSSSCVVSHVSKIKPT